MYYLRVLDSDYYQTTKYYDDRDEALKDFEIFKAHGFFIRGYLIDALTLLIIDDFDKLDKNSLPFQKGVNKRELYLVFQVILSLGRFMKQLKFRKNEFFSRPPVKKFSEYEDEYKLCEDPDSKDYDKLVKVGTINIQEEIQSYEDCALDKILDKYLDQVDDFSVEVDKDVVYENTVPDLADLGAEYSRVDELKEKYGLDDSLGYDEVISVLKAKKVELDSALLKAQDKLDKEKKNNEKTQNEQEKKQKRFQKQCT